MIEKIDLQIAYGAVKHFGRNLYTSNPPAIAELVANSWDAYATKCDIIYTEDNSLFIIDNGIGMTDEEFQGRYAISGTEKPIDQIRIPNGMDKRPYMGKKGIGKFSAFSLGEEYILYTKSLEEDRWKSIHLDYNDMLVPQANIEVPVEMIADLSVELNGKSDRNFSDLNQGTIIYIPNLRRRGTASTWEGIADRLSRRFSANIFHDYNFSLNINSKNIDLTKHYYDNNMEFVYYFGYEEQEIKNRFNHMDTEHFYKQENDFLNSNSVKGWIGTVSLPQDLKLDKEDTFGGIVVYINGKLAEENILKNKVNDRITNSYIIGEVDADFLQNESEDPVLSSREGLNFEIANVETLKNTLSDVRQKLINNWNSLRSSREIEKQKYLKLMLEDERIKVTYNCFNSEQKKRFNELVQKVFDKNEEYNNSQIKMFSPVLISIINGQIINEISIDPENEIEKILQDFYKLFDKTEINSALRIQSNIHERLKIIEDLNQNISKKAIESIFEKHLAANPWLIDPYWDRPNDKIFIETQKRYKTFIGGEEVEGRTDIIIKVAEENYPIICELKREASTSYSTPNVEEIKTQISKYRRMILEDLRNDGINISNPQDIKSYFICGEKAFEKIKDYEKIDLKNSDIVVLTYQKMIKTAQGVYYDAIK